MKSPDIRSDILLIFQEDKQWFDLSLYRVLFQPNLVDIEVVEKMEDWGIGVRLPSNELPDEVIEQWPTPYRTYFEVVMSVKASNTIGSVHYTLSLAETIKLRRVLEKQKRELWRCLYV